MKKYFFCLFVCFGGRKTFTQPWCRLYSCSWFEAIVANRKCGREVCLFFYYFNFLFALCLSLSLMLPSQEMWSTGFSCFSQEVWTKRGGVSLSFLIIILWASSSFSKCCDLLSSRLNMLELFRGGFGSVCVCEVIHWYFPDKYIPVSAENRFPVKHFDDILQQFVFNYRICLNWQNSGIPSAKEQSQKPWSLQTAAKKTFQIQ